MWVWNEDRIEVHVLRGESYEQTERSALFPDLDILQLVSFMNHPTALQAVRAFRDALRPPSR